MRSYRSPLRLFVIGLIGILLLIAAVDVMFGHWLSTPPDNNDGVLTTRGQAQQRGDIVWGAAMIGVGTLMVGGAVVELVRRKPQVVVGSQEVTMAIGPGEHDVSIPWGNVRSVNSDVATDRYDGARREQLVIDVYDRSGLPDDPLGAQWADDELRVDAHDWTRDVGDIALACQGALGHFRRVEEIKAMGPPSLVWESVVDGSDESSEPVATIAPVPAAPSSPEAGEAEVAAHEHTADDADPPTEASPEEASPEEASKAGTSAGESNTEDANAEQPNAEEPGYQETSTEYEDDA